MVRSGLHVRKAHLSMLMVTTILAVAATEARAQSAPAEPAKSLPAAEGVVIVTASKRAENLQAVPSAVTAVGQNLIARVQANNLSDVAAYVPGLNVQSAGVDANRLIVRGLTTGPQDLSPSVGVYVDDAPFGASTGLALGAIFSPDVDPFDLQRIEVLRGPQGTLYGASTLGGLVKYVTAAPNTHAFDAHVRVDWGDESDTGAENYSFRAGGNLPIIEDKVALRISGFYAKNDGDTRDARTGETGLNTLTKDGGRADLLITPIEPLSIDLIAITDFSSTPRTGLVDGNGKTLQPIYGQYAGYDDVIGFVKSRYSVYEANLKYRLPNDITLTSTTSYSTFSVNELADDTSVFVPAFGALGALFEFPGVVHPTTDKLTEEFRIASPSGARFEWLAGAFYDHESTDYLSNVTSTYLFGATPPPALAPTVAALANYETVNLGETYEEEAGFANGTFHVTPTFDIGAGVRYSHNNQTVANTGSGFLADIGVIPAHASAASSDNVWTESFDAKWTFVPGSMAYVRFANGYRPGGPNISGASFRPDTTWNYEGGLKTTGLDGRLTADVSVFYINWSNIQLNFFNGTNTITGNAGNAVSYGVEFEGSYTPMDGLVFNGNLDYTDAYISSLIPGATGGAAVGNQLPFNARWTGAIRGDYYFPLTSRLTANVGASLRYRSSSNTTFPGDPGERFYTLPDTLFGDLRAGVELDHRFALNLQVLNVAGVRKLIGASETLAVPAAVADAFGQPTFLSYAPGRTFGVSLTAKF